MFCQNCGSKMEDTDKVCSQCGFPVYEEAQAAENGTVEKAAVENTAAENQAVQSVAAETQPAQSVEAETQPVQKEVAENAAEIQPEKVAETESQVTEHVEATTPAAGDVPPETAPKAKTSFKGKKGIVIAGAGAAVLLVGALSASAMTNFVRSTFSSPEKYFSYVMEKEADEAAATITNYYENFIVNNIDLTNKSASAELTVELGEELRDLIGFTGVDISWLENVKLGVDANIKNEAIGLALKLAANGTDFISANLAASGSEEELYIQVPELNKTYIGFDFTDADIYYDDSAWEILEGLPSVLPESKDVEALLAKYVGIALNCIDDVDKDKDTVKAGGVSQKCTVLEATIDDKTLADMLEAVLEEMEKDKDLEKLIKKTVEAADELGADLDADDVYDEFLDGIDYMLDELDYFSALGDSEIVLTVWVNGDGEVIGSGIEADGMVSSSVMTRDGSKFGYECVVETEVYSYYSYEPIAITLEGSGKISGDKLNGEFALEYNNSGILDITVADYNMETVKEGYLNGTITASLSKAAASLATSALGSEAAILSAYLDYDIVLDMESSAKGTNVSLAIMDGEDMFAKLTIAGKTGSGSKVSIPADKNVIDGTDYDDLEEWLDGMDLDALLEKLEDKVGVSSDIIDALESMMSYYLYY
ncbi:MAG: zinc-ribbon domain-containing protein [Lachnospiraceae bacterium]|nr:zinc-ribbon domain-containing protein [Lachnospiraceae bacterium]